MKKPLLGILLMTAFLGFTYASSVDPVETCTGVTEIPEIECQALVALYNSTNGSNWYNATAWLDTGNICNSWNGIQCEAGHIKNIYLISNNLSGALPYEIGNLSHLYRLSIGSNEIVNIGTGISKLTGLHYLELGENRLTSLPYEIGNLSHLVYLGLVSNQIIDLGTGIINLSSLEKINLNHNELTFLPTGFGNLTNLKTLVLYDNHLLSLPDSFGNLSSLNELDLRDNRLSELPTTFKNLSNLKNLFLNNNELSSLPVNFAELSKLEFLYLGHNQISSLPSDLGSITTLKQIDLSYNGLTILPANFWNLTALNHLELNNNELTELSTGFGNLIHLRWVDISNNQLTGLMSNFCETNCGGLVRLDLSHNQLTSLRSGFGNITVLEHLDLSHNQLTLLPFEFAYLSNLLIYLNISNNHLTSLPSNFGDFNELYYLYAGNNELSSLPATFGNLRKLEYLELQNNQLTGFPNSFSNLSTLNHLYLTGNQFTGIPREITLFPRLKDLDISSNQFATADLTGTIIVTGSVQLSGATTGGIVFTTSGILNINNLGNAYNVLQIDLSGLSITTASGSWDTIILPPANLLSGDLDSANFGENGIPSQTESGTVRTLLGTIIAGSDVDSLLANGGYFRISFVVSGGNSGDTMELYRSNDGDNWAPNIPDTGCILNSNLVCTFDTNHLSYFAPLKETTTNSGSGNNNNNNNGNGGGGGGGGSNLSGTVLTGTIITGTIHRGTGSIINSPFSTEINNAYLYAYGVGITTMPTIQDADIEGPLLRSHMAKMMVNYAIKVMSGTIDTGRQCNFDDIQDQSTEMKLYIKLSCQLGIMGVNIRNFNPNGIVTRAEFGTVLSRVLYGATYNNSETYYLNHLQNLKEKGIIKNDNPLLQELRGYVMLMLMRSGK